MNWFVLFIVPLLAQAVEATPTPGSTQATLPATLEIGRLGDDPPDFDLGGHALFDLCLSVQFAPRNRGHPEIYGNGGGPPAKARLPRSDRRFQSSLGGGGAHHLSNARFRDEKSHRFQPGYSRSSRNRRFPGRQQSESSNRLFGRYRKRFPRCLAFWETVIGIINSSPWAPDPNPEPSSLPLPAHHPAVTDTPVGAAGVVEAALTSVD